MTMHSKLFFLEVDEIKIQVFEFPVLISLGITTHHNGRYETHYCVVSSSDIYVIFTSHSVTGRPN